MPFLENVLKPLHDDTLEKLQIYTHSVYQWVTIVCTPLRLSAGEEGIEPPNKFPEKWYVAYKISIFRGGGGAGFLGVVGGGCSFYIKSKN